MKVTHASSSCFILVNSSLVMEPSPSPSFCSFSREASKSGLGGAGGIWQHIYDHFYDLPCFQNCSAFWRAESNANGALTLMISVVTVSVFKCTKQTLCLMLSAMNNSLERYYIAFGAEKPGSKVNSKWNKSHSNRASQNINLCRDIWLSC